MFKGIIVVFLCASEWINIWFFFHSRQYLCYVINSWLISSIRVWAFTRGPNVHLFAHKYANFRFNGSSTVSQMRLTFSFDQCEKPFFSPLSDVCCVRQFSSTLARSGKEKRWNTRNFNVINSILFANESQPMIDQKIVAIDLCLILPTFD